MFLAVYSTLSPPVLLALGKSSATSAKWLALKVTPIFTGFGVVSGLAFFCLKMTAALLTAYLSSFSILIMLGLLADTRLRLCFRATVFAHGA